MTTKRFFRDERGATSIEYALIAILVSVVIVGAMTGIRVNLNGTFAQVSSGVSTR